MRFAGLMAVGVIALSGCAFSSFDGRRPPAPGETDYRRFSCDELMAHLAAFDGKVKQAKANRTSSAKGPQTSGRRMRESSTALVREINKRCPAMVEPRTL